MRYEKTIRFSTPTKIIKSNTNRAIRDLTKKFFDLSINNCLKNYIEDSLFKLYRSPEDDAKTAMYILDKLSNSYISSDHITTSGQKYIHELDIRIDAHLECVGPNALSAVQQFIMASYENIEKYAQIFVTKHCITKDYFEKIEDNVLNNALNTFCDDQTGNFLSDFSQSL